MDVRQDEITRLAERQDVITRLANRIQEQVADRLAEAEMFGGFDLDPTEDTQVSQDEGFIALADNHADLNVTTAAERAAAALAGRSRSRSPRNREELDP